jgi:hypothetical protein
MSDTKNINIKVFCRAFKIRMPDTSDHESFIETYIQENNLDLADVFARMKAVKERSSLRRKQRHKELTEELKLADEKFFRENGACIPKHRNCLRCNVQFYSHNGNRICPKCHKINQDYTEGCI